MANEHNKVSWSAHTLTASDGKDYYIVADSTDTDIPVSGGGLADGTLYYIYWDENSPYKYSTILASSWGPQSPAGKHIISEVTGQSSTAHHGTVKANLEYKTDVPTATKVNITAIGQQDSITAATVSNMGSTNTTGLRLKINTPGAANAAGTSSGSTDANRHWIRGYTSNSQADNNGRWLDIDGYDQSITILDGATSDNWLTKMSASGFAAYDGSSNDYLLLLLGNGSGLSHGAGLRFFKGTQTAASDATAIAHYHAGGARFYNSDGMHSSATTTNIMMDIQTDNIRFHNSSDNILLRVSSSGLTFYDGSAVAPSDGSTLAEMTSSALNFYNSSGKASGNLRTVIRANDSVDNGITLYGHASTPSGAVSNLQFKDGSGTEIGNTFVYNSGSYYSMYTLTNGVDLHLRSTEDTIIEAGDSIRLLGISGGSLTEGVSIQGYSDSAGLTFQQAHDTTSSPKKSFFNMFPPSVMNGSDTTPGTRYAAPWVNIGYYPTSSSGWNHRPINAISSYYTYAAFLGTYSAPTYSW